MKKLKRLSSFLIVLVVAFAAFSLVSPEQSVDAGVLDTLGKLFEDNNQGVSFEKYKIEESLTLDPKDYSSALTTSSNLREFIIRIVNFALGFLGLLAVLVVVYGGVLYVTAAGEEEKTQTGKKAITYATIGLLIVMGSFAFVNTIISGAGGGPGGDQKYVVGPNTGGSFNAAASQVQTLAQEIYTDFLSFAETSEELRNISNDAQKSSLDYYFGGTQPYFTGSQSVVKNVKRADVINFLFSTRERLLAIRGKTGKFSSAYIAINDLNRLLDRDIDAIQNFTEGLVEYEYDLTSDGSDGKSGLEVDSKTSSGLASCNTAEDILFACERYPAEMFKKWNGIKNELISNDSSKDHSLVNVFDPLKSDFKDKLCQDFIQIMTIKQSLGSIANQGTLKSLYDQMRKNFGYKDGVTDCKDISDGSTGSFLSAINGWKLNEPDSIDKAGQSLLAALEKQLEFAEQVSQLQSVEARLRANVVTGNAPLVVTFDVLESLDPAGQTINDKNIHWEGLIDDNAKGSVSCTIPLDKQFQEIQDKRLGEYLGPVFRQCTFKHPGTYIATVKIDSSDPTKYLQGQSSLVIKVNPPSTRINMDLKVSGKTIPVIQYYDNGLLKLDNDIIPITLDEAKKVEFDASATDNVQNFRWDFGNGKTSDSDTSGKPDSQKYSSAGKYKVELTVLNKLNETDTKVFTLDVRDVAARILVSPKDNIFINSPVRIDGTASAASKGKIKSYEWKLSKKAKDKTEEISLGNSQNQSSFSYSFKEPCRYQIGLKVSSDLETADATPYELVVNSKPPVALFDHSIPNTSQPGTVHFNASKSFDPDGDSKNLEYKWTIQPASENGKNWVFVEDGVFDPNTGEVKGKNPVIKFKKKGDYQVTLQVPDSNAVQCDLAEEVGETTQTIEINNSLDIGWAETQAVTAVLDADNKAPINFDIVSDNAVAYEIDFGDGEVSSGDIQGSKQIPYTYKKSGKFTVKVTAYDENDNDNTIKRRVFVSDSNTPISKISLRINGDEVTDLSDVISVSKTDILTFDGSNSKNIDGTGRDLNYSWNFGDTKTSTNRTTTHSFKELSPKDPGYFQVTLQVRDKDDPTKSSEDEIRIKVENKAPTFSSIQAIPEDLNGDFVTPVNINLQVFGAQDDDGDISQYRWWYFDTRDPDEPLGLQITQNSSTRMTIGTLGQEGKEVTYGFGVQLVDTDNLTVSSDDIIPAELIPTVTVKNGPNELPTAKFSVNNTKTFTNEKVTFTSSSKDTDGKIVQYIWDFEGDGFFNNKPTKESTVQHTYDTKNLQGYEVRLKVVDDKGGEAVSPPIKIYVDSLAKEPTAAFEFQVLKGSNGRKIKFKNNSTADEDAGAKIISHSWDFDIKSSLDTADSDGDGKKDNDVDSQAKNPDRLYTESGTYTVRLTVTDDQGNTDTVEHEIKIPLADPPVAAFTFEVDKNDPLTVRFKNNSTADKDKGAKIDDYIWDFDTASTAQSADSDGDGNKANDEDSDDKDPKYKFPAATLYKVKLTVVDNFGNRDDVINTIDLTPPTTVITPGNPSQPGGQQPTPVTPTGLQAKMVPTPAPSSDGIVYLDGQNGYVTFNFSGSLGPISKYVFDKNIYFDTNGDGIKNNEEDFKTSLPGTWKTYFDKAWGKIVVKLTVYDIHGNQNSVTQEIRFK